MQRWRGNAGDDLNLLHTTDLEHSLTQHRVPYDRVKEAQAGRVAADAMLAWHRASTAAMVYIYILTLHHLAQAAGGAGGAMLARQRSKFVQPWSSSLHEIAINTIELSALRLKEEQAGRAAADAMLARHRASAAEVAPHMAGAATALNALRAARAQLEAGLAAEKEAAAELSQRAEALGQRCDLHLRIALRVFIMCLPCGGGGGAGAAAAGRGAGPEV